MKVRASIIALLGSIFLCSVNVTLVFAKIKNESAKAAQIQKLLEVSGAREMGLQVMAHMVESMKLIRPDIDEAYWDGFLTETDLDSFSELLIPIYDKYYTEKEIAQLVEFYESPLGRKMVRVQPELIKDSMVAGQEWGRKLGQKIADKLEEMESDQEQ